MYSPKYGLKLLTVLFRSCSVIHVSFFNINFLILLASGEYDLKVSSDCSDADCSAAGPWSGSKTTQVDVFSASITEFQSEQYAVLLGVVLLIIVGIA